MDIPVPFTGCDLLFHGEEADRRGMVDGICGAAGHYADKHEEWEMIIKSNHNPPNRKNRVVRFALYDM